MKRLLSLLLALMLCLFLFACDNGSTNGGEQSGGLPVGEDPALPDRIWD